MPGSDVSAVVNYFATPNEGFSTTLGGTISSGATTVPLTSVTGLTNGTIFVGIIEPGGTKQQVFTGTVDTGGSQITGVKWTRGSNVGHTAGVSIVDYVTGTAFHMLTVGLLKEHHQSGTHGVINATSLATTGDGAIGGNLSVTGNSTHTGATVLTGAVSGAGYSMLGMNNPHIFRAYGTTAQSIPGSTFTKIIFDSESFDPNSNFDSVTNSRYTATISGFYQFNGYVNVSANPGTFLLITLYKNGTAQQRGTQTNNTGAGGVSYNDLIQITAGDYFELFIYAVNATTIDNAVTNRPYFSGFRVST